jgi:hypothetical protein
MAQFEVTIDTNTGKPNIKITYNTAPGKLEEKVLAKFVSDATNNANKIVIAQESSNGITTITFSVVPVV